jgi:hypothetical protein
MRGPALLDIAQDHEALLENATGFGLKHRQRRGAAGLLQKPIWAWLGDVDHPELDRARQPFEREQDLDPLRKRADGDVIDDRAGHGVPPSRGTIMPRRAAPVTD